MKNITSILVFLFSNLLIAQDLTSSDYTLTVIDNHSQPVSNLPISIIETSTYDKVTKRDLIMHKLNEEDNYI
jgi:hypothetical protein